VRNKMEIIKTEGSRNSIGAYMIKIEEDVYLCNNEGDNAWDTYEEAEQVIKEWRKLNG